MMNAAKLTIVAPSRSVVTDINASGVDHARIDRAVNALSAMGWKVTEAPNCRRNVERFAGSDSERAAGFMAAMLDPECDLVMSLRGGYGAARLLERIDWTALKETQARFVGLSDTTALNMALWSMAGRSSWQGPTAVGFATPNALRDARFRAALSERPFHYEGEYTGENVDAQGLLWGGNLSILVSLIGTPYFPEIEGGILYVEDIAEPAWRIERMLLQLFYCGVLGRQKALLVGRMLGSETAAGEGDSHFGLAQCLSQIRQRSAIPVIEGLPFGHIPETMLMPFGAEAHVLSAGQRLSIVCANPPLPTNQPWTEAQKTYAWWQ